MKKILIIISVATMVLFIFRIREMSKYSPENIFDEIYFSTQKGFLDFSQKASFSGDKYSFAEKDYLLSSSAKTIVSYQYKNWTVTCDIFDGYMQFEIFCTEYGYYQIRLNIIYTVATKSTEENIRFYMYDAKRGYYYAEDIQSTTQMFEKKQVSVNSVYAEGMSALYEMLDYWIETNGEVSAFKKGSYGSYNEGPLVYYYEDPVTLKGDFTEAPIKKE